MTVGRCCLPRGTSKIPRYLHPTLGTNPRKSGSANGLLRAAPANKPLGPRVSPKIQYQRLFFENFAEIRLSGGAMTSKRSGTAQPAQLRSVSFRTLDPSGLLRTDRLLA